MLTAQAQGGNITVFSDGTAEHTVTVNSGQHSAVGFMLERNTTINSASFFMKPDSSGSSPGWVELDVNLDGAPEWSFNQVGYGNFGQQVVFHNDQSVSNLSISPTTTNFTNPFSPAFFLPTGATLSSANMDIGFSPTLTGGFFPTGFVHSTDIGDVNNDNKDDVVMFSQTAHMTAYNATSNTTTTTVGEAFRIVSYDALNGVNFSSWVPTCANVTRTMAADLNGDGFDDVVNYAKNDAKLCIHFVNSTTGLFQPQINVSVPSGVIDFGFEEFNGNGFDQMVSIRSGGKVSVDQFSNRSNSFSNVDEMVIYVTGTTTPRTFTHMVMARFDGELDPPSVIAATSSGDGTEVWWSNTSSSLAGGTNTIDGVSQTNVVGDFDGDGDLDIIASTSGGSGYRTIRHGFTNWAGNNHMGSLDLTNASVYDFDMDQTPHFLMPNGGSPDGNPATLDGNITAHEFYTSGSWNNQNRHTVRTSQSFAVLEPGTAPRAIFFADLDGDGIKEHIVLGGEGSQLGVFISAWHTIGYDIEHDGMPDVNATGYAGDGSRGLAPLALQDLNGILSSRLNLISSGLNYTTDSYGIQMSPVTLSMHAMAEGVFTFSNLDLPYVADFLVNTNPQLSGNLSNALNQRMTLGTGNFLVPFVFNTSQNGSFILTSPSVNYQDGAPNLALPPRPQVSVVDLAPDHVRLQWQNRSDFGSDVLRFAVYRSVAGQAINTSNPYVQVSANATFDSAVQPGQSWTYWVRSVHEFGVVSNLSVPVTVTVPFPVPKSHVPNVSAMDAPNDTGGALDISWGAGDPSIVEHRIYVLNSNFTSIAEQSTVHITNATTFGLQVREDSLQAPLVDGTAYFVAVVGFDSYGNASDNISAFGPVYSRNDTALSTTLDVTFEGFDEVEGLDHLLLSRQRGLNASAHLHQNGTPIANAPLELLIVGATEQYTVQGTTNASGYALFSLDSLSSLGPIKAVGNMTLKVAYPGSVGDAVSQPLEGASNTTEAFGTIELEVQGPSEIALADSMTFDETFTVSTLDPLHQDLLLNLVVDWTVLNGTTELGTGTADLRANELSIAGQGAYDALLLLSLPVDPPVYYLPGMTASYAFEASPVVEEPTNTTNSTNSTGEPTVPTTTGDPVIDCDEEASYPWMDEGTDEAIVCTLTNPNPFSVEVAFTWTVLPTTPPPITFDVASLTGSTTVTLAANASMEVIFTPTRNGPSDGLFPGVQGVGYLVTFECVAATASPCPTNESSSYLEDELIWTLGEMPTDDTDPTGDPQADDTSSAMTPVVVGIGLVLVLIAALGGVLFMRGRMDDGENLDEEVDFYSEAMEQPASRADAVDVYDLSSSQSLDDLKEQGKELHEAAPEGLASSPTLGSSADAFEFGATAEDTTSEADEENDDGIRVDEFGTEWWEDEDGVWWYREEGWDDWAVWEE